MPDADARWPEDKDGFRLRGMEMTRIEAFTDAAFAFAVTLLVISTQQPSARAIPGWVYVLLPVVMPFYAQHSKRVARRLRQPA